MALLAVLAAALAACCPPAVSGAAEEPEAVHVQAPTFAERFEGAWRLVAERYWDLGGLGVDWDEVGERYRARLDEVESDDDLYDLLEAMYEEIGDQHSVFVRPQRVAEVRRTYGDLPCLAVFGAAAAMPGATLALTYPAAGLAQAAGGLVTDEAGPIGFGMTEADGRPVGYVRVPDLASDGVAEGVRQATVRLERAGAEALVLDLRGNPGGRLVTMMQVAGVFTRGFLWRAVLSWSLPVPYPAIGEPATDLPLYVLVDGDVHSAAEGLAGALQDSGRATVVGERTAGNVEAVLPFCLRDGSQAWIATGVLAPLLGATWEGRGVEPDVPVEGARALEEALALLGEGR
ncbi:MAG TPA: S41 family peptidase [Trueperaceae bacterium]|nr:S41 family peptidase [Trueperaceae bacterium]